MIWPSVSSLLADLVEQPVIVIDDGGAVRLANHAAEKMLGTSRECLVGRAFAELVPLPERESFGLFLSAALAGARRRGQLAVVSDSGQRLAVTVEVAALASRGHSAILCVVVASRVDVAAPSWPSAWMEIRTEGRFGEVTAVEGGVHAGVVGQLCHAVLFGEAVACTDCPVARLGPGDDRTDICTRPGHEPMLQQVYRNSPFTAQISYTPLRAELVSKLLSTRLDELAARCALSEREREVLDELLTGRTLDEIAGSLRISTRTVRFHQANVLAKLGIESRLDLIRVLVDG